MREILTLKCTIVNDRYSFTDKRGKEWMRLSPATNPSDYQFEPGKWYELTFNDGFPEALTSHDHWCDWGHWIRRISDD